MWSQRHASAAHKLSSPPFITVDCRRACIGRIFDVACQQKLSQTLLLFTSNFLFYFLAKLLNINERISDWRWLEEKTAHTSAALTIVEDIEFIHEMVDVVASFR